MNSLTIDYKDLAMRKDVREDSWSRPGWDEVVAYTGKVYLLIVN